MSDLLTYRHFIFSKYYSVYYSVGYLIRVRDRSLSLLFRLNYRRLIQSENDADVQQSGKAPQEKS